MSEPVRIKTTVAKPDPQPESKSDLEPEPQLQSKPEPKPESQSLPKSETSSETNPETPKPEPESRIKVTDVKARPKPRIKRAWPPANAKFAIFATATVLAAAGTLAALWPLALTAARHESANLVGEGNQAHAGEAATDYLLATWLDRHNTAAYAGLARTQIAAGQPDAALTSLTHAGEGSEVEQLRVRTLIELGRASDAAAAGGALTTPGRSQNDLLLAVLAYENAGRHTDTTALIPRLTSPDTAEGAARAQAGPLGLATELYATGLLRSSSAILTKAPTSYQRNLLLARIRYAQHTKSALTDAADYLATANALNPANTEARLLLTKVYRELGNTHDAQVQTALIAKLQAGRP